MSVECFACVYVHVCTYVHTCCQWWLEEGVGFSRTEEGMMIVSHVNAAVKPGTSGEAASVLYH